MFNSNVTPDYFEPWLQFKTPIVRQLAFCIASQTLLNHIPPDLEIKHSFEFHQQHIWQTYYHAYKSRLLKLDQEPKELVEFLARLKSTRLGLRFENLLWFWLQDEGYHPYKLLGHSIQKISGSTTLGEIDFLLLNQQTQEIEHWEVALKYYLAEGELQLSDWFGLNREDHLQRKLQHFTERQFQFSKVDDCPIQRKFVVLKGQLYLPDNHDLCSLPDWINTARRLGQWGYTIPSSAYFRLQRQEWICPNLDVSSQAAQWWTNGLYYNETTELKYYMFRQPPLLSHSF
ncbi:MAG: DUF1853 family protein [Acinetobacter sp.]